MPFAIDKEVLAVAIEGNNLEDALLNPAQSALTKIAQSVEIFTAMIDEALREGQKSK